MPGLYHPQGSEPGHGGTFFRCRRAVRPHCKRHGTGQTAPSVGRRGNRHGGTVRLLEKYLCLSLEDTGTLEDIELGDEGVRIGDKRLSVYTLSELDALPGRVGTDSRYERLSTDRSDCRLSFASPVGLLLPCNHIYNQYLFIDDSAENLQRFEKTARNMQSLSRYSRSNQINKEWIDLYLNDAHSYGLTSVRCHCNVIAWTDNPDEVKVIRNDTGSQIAAMECKPRHDTVDAATLYWAGMPATPQTSRRRNHSIPSSSRPL